MSISSISHVAPSLIQPVTSSLSSANTNSTDSSSLAIPQDGAPQISGAAQFLNSLQQLSTSNPTEFKQITSQLSQNLTAAATQAQSAGDTTQSTELTNLASQFSTASQTGQLPSSLTSSQNGQSSSTGQSPITHHGRHHHHAGSAYGTSQSDSSDILSTLGSSSTTSSSTGTSTAASAKNGL